MTGGSLGGIIEARDVDAVADGAEARSIRLRRRDRGEHPARLGYGLDGLNGRNLFSVGPVAGAAA